ncbi:MAG: hypothetical protein JW850_00850 [Thermoflexales bacterium]|nr:hypothetical protein [Thermoflexales bacterium]
MKRSQLSCLGLVLILVLLAMMVGVIGMVSMLRSGSGAYTVEEEQWLLSNYQREMRQDAPMVNTYGSVAVLDGLKQEGKVSTPPIATGARESHVTVDLNVRYKEHGGAAVTAYDMDFSGVYLVANPGSQPAALEMNFPFPQNAVVLSEVSLKVDGAEPPDVTYSMQSIRWLATLEAGQEKRVEIRYRAEGVGSFAYGVPASQRVRDYDLRVTVRGASEINVPEEALEPTAREDTPAESVLSWRYLNVITNRSVQVELPARPSLAFAQRVEKLGPFFVPLAMAAPFLTVLFLILLWAIARMEALPVALEHGVLLGIGFFLFYPLFIFAANFVPFLPLAFAIALVVGGLLVVGYGAWMFGGKLAAVYLLPLLIVFYGLLTRGLTESRYLGVMLVLSGVILVGLFMWRVSQRHRPADTLSGRLFETAAPPGPSIVEPAVPVEPTPAEEGRVASRLEDEGPSSPPPPKPAGRFCIHCGQGVGAEFKFCPQCGEEAQLTRRCERCGLEYVPSDEALNFCPACGQAIPET